MAHKVLDDGVERDATPEEIAEHEARANEPARLPRRHITELALRHRLTDAEKVAIEMAALDDPAAGLPQRQLAARLRVYLADIRAALFIDLDMPKTRAGVQDLEDMGLIETGRAAQILDAAIQPEELPL